MPTGYTAAVQDGTVVSFKDFALLCARAFGATILMRDDPMDAPIPESFPPHTEYHDKALAAAEEALRTIPTLSAEDCAARARSEFDEAVSYRQKRQKEERQARERYSAMLKKVERWIPPSPDHREMKDFMVKQLTGSIEFDTGHEREALTLKTGEQWKAVALANADRDLAYHSTERAKEIERTAERNRWVAALRESLSAYQE